MGLSKKQRAFNGKLPRASDCLVSLRGVKMRLDCGHRVTLGHNLTNTLLVYAGKGMETACHNCGY